MKLGGTAFQTRVGDGTVLAGRDYGDRATRELPVVCLPGLTRNHRDFDALARALSESPERPRRVIAVDSRGRGRSERADPKTYTPQVEANDVLSVMVARGIEHAGFVGTSRGGLLCMAIAALRPGVLKAVVLNDIGPVIHVAYLAGLKDYVSGAGTPASWDQAAAELKSTFSSTFTALRDQDWQQIARQLYDEEDGRPALAFDTRLAETLTGITASSPPVSIWPLFLALSAVPVLALRGANSPLLDRQTFQDMAARHPRCELHEVADQGHAPLLWDQDSQRRIAGFLDLNA